MYKLHTVYIHIYRITSIKRPPRINAPPPKGGAYLKHSVISREKHVFTLFELLDEDIVKVAHSFYLIDEENDDEELEILQTF